MNKAESKYFNTAKLMNQALLYLLEKKNYDKITVKQLCEKAGVNRSTFYLHYESMDDLLIETIEILNKEFQNSFNGITIKHDDSKPYFFITEEYIVPYLTFVKKNKRVLKTIHDNPKLFNVKKEYNSMCENIFYPAVKSFLVGKKEIPYILEYYTKGVVAIINKWIELNCEDSIEYLSKLIIGCVNYSLHEQ